MTPPRDAPMQSADTGPRPPVSGVPRLHSAELFDGHREVVIVHKGEEYRLRLTRQEKLILTK